MNLGPASEYVEHEEMTCELDAACPDASVKAEPACLARKPCSPDNAAMEGFFGRLKNEFFYYRSWDGVAFEGFSRSLDDYIDYYNNRRKKKSLGWMSPMEYRISLGFAA